MLSTSRDGQGHHHSCVCVLNLCNNKKKITNTMAPLFSRLLTSSTNNITTNECMHHTIIKTSVITETSDNLIHSYVSTSKHTKVNTIMSAKRTDNTLQLTRVKGPMFTRSIHITFQHSIGRSTEWVEKFTDISMLIYEYAYPVVARFIGRLRVTHQ